MKYLSFLYFILAATIFKCTAQCSFIKCSVAIIKDKDAFVNIRLKPDTSSSITGRLKATDFFYCLSKGTWDKIFVPKWNDGKQLEGYVYNSSIQLLRDLPNREAREIIIAVFKKHDSKGTQKENSTFLDEYYHPILQFLPIYISTTKDSIVFRKYLELVIKDSGSADEMLSFAIGWSYICTQHLVAQEVKRIENRRYRELITNDLNWGIANFWVSDDGKRLLKQNPSARKQATTYLKANGLYRKVE
ncbi:MAG: hypothetical protein H0X33_13715 [Taibaiella sp.]|nr:hypothetical protein [Taibaiella sp.]